MSWSKTAPADIGFYWWRHSEKSEKYPVEVCLSDYCGLPAPIMQCRFWLDDEIRILESIGGEWWSEPIKEPE